jgi:hypothetical protein
LFFIGTKTAVEWLCGVADERHSHGADMFTAAHVARAGNVGNERGVKRCC